MLIIMFVAILIWSDYEGNGILISPYCGGAFLLISVVLTCLWMKHWGWTLLHLLLSISLGFFASLYFSAAFLSIVYQDVILATPPENGPNLGAVGAVYMAMQGIVFTVILWIVSVIFCYLAARGRRTIKREEQPQFRSIYPEQRE